MNKQTPFQGLKILEKIHKKQPNNQVSNNLINAYIKLGYHDIALNIISDIPDNKIDAQSLQFKAWKYHKNKAFSSEKELWETILQKTSFPAIHPEKIPKPLLLNNKKISINENDIALFCVERNEMLRLPFFLQHYRNLGVTKFFFIDNNSDDGSYEFLSTQNDCYVFWTNDSYIQAGAGMIWINQLVDTYVDSNQWYLIVDADELLIYPNCEQYNLRKLTTFLDKSNFELLASFMLDMFPKSLEQQLKVKHGENLINFIPYFYNHYEVYDYIHAPYVHHIGGIFYYFGQYLKLTKTPLMKKSANIKPLFSTHNTTPALTATISSVLLHFKFLGDFQSDANTEIKRKEHTQGGRSYRIYSKIFDRYINRNFDFTELDKTTKYQNSQQLVDLGLIKSPRSWKDFITKEGR